MKKIILAKEKKLKQNFYKFEDNNILTQPKQITLINKIYLNFPDENSKFIFQEIKKKINSYKNQDKEKSLLNENLIKEEELLEKLVCSKLKCYYCKKNILFFYENCREETQWTLDRINNNLGHSNSNTLISCLKCNLKRRCQNSEAFKFTKQLSIKKI